MDNGTKELIVPVKAEGLDEALEKARELREILKEAKSLINDIASLKIELHLER